MLTWLSQNLATIIICAVLAGVICSIIIVMVRNKKKGKSACGCGCQSCPLSGDCHKKK